MVAPPPYTLYPTFVDAPRLGLGAAGRLYPDATPQDGIAAWGAAPDHRKFVGNVGGLKDAPDRRCCVSRRVWMAMESALQAPASAQWTFNPFDPAFRADPHPTYDRLRAEKPYLRTLGTVVLTQYDPVMEVLKSRNFSVALIPATISEQLAKLGFRGIELVERLVRKLIVFTDNPDHARLRRLVNQAYTPA